MLFQLKGIHKESRNNVDQHFCYKDLNYKIELNLWVLRKTTIFSYLKMYLIFVR